MKFVEINNLSKSFGETRVFSDLDVTIEKGEFITLLGPSGCGKSTLLRSIAGLVEVNSGQIMVNGKDITKKSARERNISMVFQSYALFPNMTVEENIGFGLKMRRIAQADIHKKVAKFIDLVELNGREKFYPSELSGGQQQRVALARALVIEPDILLLDEPLSALDAKIRKHLRMQIRNLQKQLNITTIFVTHDQEEALTISDRIFLMNDGYFAQIGTPEEVYIHPASEFVARFMGNYNVLSDQSLKKLLGKDVECGVYAIRPEGVSIEEKGSRACVALSGTVEDAIVLGGVIRHRIRCQNDQHIIVDVLNKGEAEWHEIGSTVNLFIPYDELKKVG